MALLSDEQNPQALLNMKAALTQMTLGDGWRYLKKIAEHAIRDLERDSVGEEDDAKANGLRRDARGARKFWESLEKRLELAKAYSNETAEDPADEFFAILEEKKTEPQNERNVGNR